MHADLLLLVIVHWQRTVSKNSPFHKLVAVGAKKMYKDMKNSRLYLLIVAFVHHFSSLISLCTTKTKLSCGPVSNK